MTESDFEIAFRDLNMDEKLEKGLEILETRRSTVDVRGGGHQLQARSTTGRESLLDEKLIEDLVKEEQTVPKNGVLEWRGLTFGVGKEKILSDCYGRLYPGELCALVGPSGAGKSTLMNLLAGRQKWSGKDVNMGGRVTFAGKAVGFDDLKDSIGYVMQEDRLMSRRFGGLFVTRWDEIIRGHIIFITRGTERVSAPGRYRKSQNIFGGWSYC